MCSKYLAIIFVSVSFSLCISCKGAKEPIPKIKIETDSVKRCNMTQNDFKVIDSLTLPDAILRFGEPFEKNVFLLNDALQEDRIELYNYYPSKEYRDRKIEVTECIWSFGKELENNITVWYILENNTWKYLHKNEWKKGDEF